MDFGWLTVWAEGQTTPCIAPVQLAYLVALLLRVVLFALVGRRARDLTTATLTHQFSSPCRKPRVPSIGSTTNSVSQASRARSSSVSSESQP